MTKQTEFITVETELRHGVGGDIRASITQINYIKNNAKSVPHRLTYATYHLFKETK